MEENKSLITYNGMKLGVTIKNNEIEIEMGELAKAIGYTDVRGLKKLLDTNPELKNKEFSYLKKVDSIENGVVKKREKRLFTEDGLYEVTMLANTENAKKFRRFVRELMKKYRKNELILRTPTLLPAQQAQLDEMVGLIKARDGEIGDLLDSFEAFQGYLTDIEVIKDDVKLLIELHDKLVKEVKELKKEVFGTDE
ncbi:hypothetical protein CBG60_00195 [Fusobacterium animalis]|uniref:Bro-N domain-containing protein n=2 Tax=Fusobacterium animalis TaxID=76859 RepID=A0A140PR95_9FUSO|nr:MULTISPECIES: BRO family protein [Fusobacterium]ALF22128.1 hypothetical protein RO08_07370 [Fusobacterium animalis]ASG29842.1 hypothetical protein CBG60_00195 [Fusobacterium animalis]EEO42684.2 hypothetical protein FSDG_01243 [Fusobacterium animalis 7_1]EPC07775.1 hypothetical protein HMPREF9369_02584 [Fusobacterium polymorphum F0401]ERT41384.1 hypothetical protein HMPREF1538_00996 [Fusobacterium nucleatum CTI-1]